MRLAFDIVNIAGSQVGTHEGRRMHWNNHPLDTLTGGQMLGGAPPTIYCRVWMRVSALAGWPSRSSFTEPHGRKHVAKMRVHELAKEFGVESKVIISRLTEMNEFVKSASSELPPPVVKRFYRRHGDEWSDGAPRSQLPAVDPARIVPRPRPPKAAPRPTSWDDSIFNERGRQIWFRYGLGENDARLAQRLLEAGLMPEDLQLRLRGRLAVSRLRGGEEPWTLLFKEMREVRASGDPRPPEAPSRAVTRRWKAS